jgi:hypothetical protein
MHGRDKPGHDAQVHMGEAGIYRRLTSPEP